MELKEQVLSIEQMNHLKELGVEVKDTALSIVRVRNDGTMVMPSRLYIESHSVIPTLTFQEILEMLPESISVNGYDYVMIQKRIPNEGIETLYRDVFALRNLYDNLTENYLQAAFNTLCWIAQNGYLNKK